MERLSTCQLREKEVVNVCDGAVLGCPSDFEFDIRDGRITAIVLPSQSSFFGFCRGDDVIIPWCKIECIGEDTILVRLSADECHRLKEDKKKKWIWKL